VATDALGATSSSLITYSSATGRVFFNQNGSAAGFGTGGHFITIQGPRLTSVDNSFELIG
jgi:hypothetical protein